MTEPAGIDATFHFPTYPSAGRPWAPAGEDDASGDAGTSGDPSSAVIDAVFRVWAPLAESVALAWRRAEDDAYREAPIERAELDGLGFLIEEATHLGGGWHAVTEPSPALTAAIGSRAVLEYGLLLDAESPLLPDPRSRRQPTGPHGPSATVPDRDPALASAADPAPTPHPAPASAGAPASAPPRSWDASPVYELHIGTFTPEGTFDAAIERLDHIVSLGVGWIELLPVNTFAGAHNWGYDGVGWMAVQETYGGPAGYRRLVDAAHRRGLGVLQDVVFNHLGPSGNHLGRFGPYLHSVATNPWGDSTNLDGPESDEVRAYILDTLGMFVNDYDVDGFRLDAVHAFTDSRAVHILEDMAIHMDALGKLRGRPVPLIAESDRNDPATITARDDGGLGMSAQWNDDFHHALHVALTGETTGYYPDFAAPGALAKTLRGGFFHDGTHSSFRGRAHGRPIDPSRVTPDRLVVFAQDHDQIGNRAAGERLGRLVDDRRLAIAACLVMLAPATPMLFMGEEWGAGTPWQFFTDHREEWLGRAVSEGRASEFARMGWDAAAVPDPQDPATFVRSRLDWSEIEDVEATGGSHDHRAILELHRRLGTLRAERPEFRDLDFPAISVVEHPVQDASGSGTSGTETSGSALSGLETAGPSAGATGVLAVEFGSLAIIVNFGPEARRVPLAHPSARILIDTAAVLGSDADSIGSDACSLASDADGTVLRLPGASAVVLDVEVGSAPPE